MPSLLERVSMLEVSLPRGLQLIRMGSAGPDEFYTCDWDTLGERSRIFKGPTNPAFGVVAVVSLRPDFIFHPKFDMDTLQCQYKAALPIQKRKVRITITKTASNDVELQEIMDLSEKLQALPGNPTVTFKDHYQDRE